MSFRLGNVVQNQVLRLFSAPVFPRDEEKTRKARYSHAITLAFLGLVIAYEAFVRVFVGYTGLTEFDLIMAGVAVLSIAGLLLLQKGYVRLTSVLMVVLIWVASNGLASTGFGARDASYLVNFAIILMAGLLLGWQASLLVTLMSIIAGVVLAFAEREGLIVTAPYSVTAFVGDMAFVFVLTGMLLYLLIRGLENALRRSQINLLRLESMNTDLNQTQDALQKRSAELLAANQQLEIRTRKLQSVAVITRTVASMQKLDLLLTSVTKAINEYLGYDFVGVFLLDEEREFVVLQSTSMDSALEIVAVPYKFSVKTNGLISRVIQTGQPEIANDLGQNSMYPLPLNLAKARSELLVPLKSGEQVIGVLDIRSTQAQAFNEDDVFIFSVLADQVSINIQNLLLYEQSQRALRQADNASKATSARAWQRYEKVTDVKGYHYDGIRSEPLRAEKTVLHRDAHLEVPIQLRGQTIGSFKLNPSDPSRDLTEDELAMVSATAERVALAMESARLLDEAQRRAAREEFLSDLATKLSSSFQLDSILRDTVEELGHTLKNTVVTFQLVNPSEIHSSSENEPTERTSDRSSRGETHA